MLWANSHKQIKLPTSANEFDQLVDNISSKYDIKDKRHIGAVIAMSIKRLPNDQGYTTLGYLNCCIIKSLSNHVCNYKAESIKHETQVEMLVSAIEKDPNDMEARDMLFKAATEGSLQAQTALSKMGESFELPKADQTVS